MAKFSHWNNKKIAAQCVFPRLDIDSYLENKTYQNEIKELAKIGCGGFCIFQGNIETVKKVISELQMLSEIPLLFCADFENGLQMRLEDGTSFPHSMALAKTGSYTFTVAQAIAKEAKELGVLWNLAPVCDINSNPKNPVINVRSFGENSKIVTENILKYIEATQTENVAACAKHFPGHGDTETDSHTNFPILTKDFDELEQNELVPFSAAINGNTENCNNAVGAYCICPDGININNTNINNWGVCNTPLHSEKANEQKASNKHTLSVMIGHLIVEKLDSEFPASLSKKIVTDLLRKKLNFDGIIVTDGLDMKSITNKYNSKEIAELAVNAGIDVLLIPENPKEIIENIELLIEKNEHLKESLLETVNRIYNLKIWTKLIPRFATSDGTVKTFSEHLQLALRAAVEATEVIFADHDNTVGAYCICPTIQQGVFNTPLHSENETVNNLIPLDENKNYAAFSIIQKAEDIQAASRFFTMLAGATENDCDYAYLDETISEEELNALKEGIVDAEFVIFALFFRGRGYVDSLASVEKINKILEHLSGGREFIVIFFGDPYIASTVEGKIKILTYSDSFASLAAAIMKLTGRKFE